MIPTTITVLDHIPRTPNGKIDRNHVGTLLATAGSVCGVDTVATPHADGARLAGLWQAEFNLLTVSVDDNFFDLGGHSLMALRLFPKAEREFQVKLSFGLLFEHVTIASMASVIDRELGTP